MCLLYINFSSPVEICSARSVDMSFPIVLFEFCPLYQLALSVRVFGVGNLVDTMACMVDSGVEELSYYTSPFALYHSFVSYPDNTNFTTNKTPAIAPGNYGHLVKE